MLILAWSHYHCRLRSERSVTRTSHTLNDSLWQGPAALFAITIQLGALHTAVLYTCIVQTGYIVCSDNSSLLKRNQYASIHLAITDRRICYRSLTLYRHIKTAEQRTIIQQRTVIGTLAVDGWTDDLLQTLFTTPDTPVIWLDCGKTARKIFATVFARG